MANNYYLKDSKRFWETRKKAREAKDKRLTRLPVSEKAAIAERIQADYELLQNAKDETKHFGLGDIPDAANELSIELSFTQSDFQEASNKVFPFTQELQADQESSKHRV